jgi:hypothetical protein
VRRPLADTVPAALLAGTLSGLPSTVHALARGRSPLAATRAAGVLLGRPGVVRGAVAHAALSAAWASVLVVVLPRRREPVWGALAGLVIAALDLGLAERRWPEIAALPTAPQVADHVAFGALAGAVLAARRRAEPATHS